MGKLHLPAQLVSIFNKAELHCFLDWPHNSQFVYKLDIIWSDKKIEIWELHNSSHLIDWVWYYTVPLVPSQM